MKKTSTAVKPSNKNLQGGLTIGLDFGGIAGAGAACSTKLAK